MNFRNKNAGDILLKIIRTIQQNKDYLSEIDGKIGDGDHGVNMNKGFTLCEERLKGNTYSLSEGFSVLSRTLMDDIGGSMGPLYGVFFDELASECTEVIDAGVFRDMLNAALAGIQDIGNAKQGDKTLIDTLIPAIDSYSKSLAEGENFSSSLDSLKRGAASGWKSTEDMIAKIGRASRLGERSRGVLDAGATSCYFILIALADGIRTQLLK